VLDVKISLRCAALATSLALLGAATSAVAQTNQPINRTPVRPAAAPAPSGGAVAVIDISKLFKEHPGFRAKLEIMKKDVTAAESNLRGDRDEIKKMVDQLKTFTPGSPNYKATEERIALAQSQLQLKVNLQKKDFMEEEARIYYEVYTEIEKEVAAFAIRHGISLVLRYTDIEMNPEIRENVLAGVNQAVVFQNRIDITKDIMDVIRGNYPPDRVGNTGGGTIPVGPRR
jgi:Skp family chaperone for outer membrane proteins